ncbi:pentapeptide repeat-containing protein [Streptomyces niveus]
MTGVYLSYADLRGWRLSGCDLSDAFLTGTDLSEAQLMNASLLRANAGLADFTAADLSGTRADHRVLSRARLAGATLHGASLRRAKLPARSAPTRGMPPKSLSVLQGADHSRSMRRQSPLVRGLRGPRREQAYSPGGPTVRAARLVAVLAGGGGQCLTVTNPLNRSRLRTSVRKPVPSSPGRTGEGRTLATG